MFDIVLYHNKNGKSQIEDYLRKLAKATGKAARIKNDKVHDVIQALSVYGTEGMPVHYRKYLRDKIWELRPLDDRILFAGVVGGRYVLLHQFQKKTQKTPTDEIDKAIIEFEDYKKRSGEE